MPTLAELRTRLPELDGLDDESAILAIQQAYYPSVPAEALAQRLGYTPPAPPVDEPGFVRSAGDSALALGQGVVTGIKGLTDLAGADNPVSQALGSANETMSGMLSAFRQNELQQRAQKIKEAEESGSTLNEVGAYLGGVAEAPLDTTLQAVGAMVPNIAAMMIPGVRESRIAALAAGGAVGAAQGTGFVKGGIYESVKQRAIEEGRSPEEAEALAVEAQRYGGKNSGQMVLGAGLGAGAALGPVERIVSGMARRTATQGMLKAPERLLPRVALGSSAEAFPEGLQGGQQKLAENLAQDRAGFETDPMRGVLGSAALEAAAAAGPGGAVSLPKPAAEAPKPRKPSLAEGLTKIAEAPTVDDAIKAMGETLDNKPADEPEAPTGGGMDRLRTILPDKQRREVLGLMATAGNPNSPPNVRRYAENRIDAIIREYTDIPVADVIEEADMLPTGEARELTDAERADFVNARRFSDERRIARGIPTGEATEALPTGDATEVEPIPVGDAAETIPTGEAFETLPVGEATEAIPTGEATELPKRIPTGTATELTPEVIDGDLLTGDGMPYGSKAGALVRAKREGLTPGNVVEIPGAGWVVRPVIEARPAGTRGTTAADVLPKETPREPVGNMAGTAGEPVAAGAGRASDAGGSSVAVGGMATDPGRGDQRVAGTPVAGGAEAAPAGDGGGADQALKAVGGEYTLSDAISADGPTEETVKLIVRPDGTAAIQRDDGDVIDVTNMARAGYTAERIIAQSLGDDTSGSNVKRSGAKTAPNVSNPTPPIDTPSERVEQAPAGGRVGPATAQRAIDAFNADDAKTAMDVVSRLPLAQLQEVGAAIGFRPQINENAKRYRERLAEVADKFTKTARETMARERKLFDQIGHLASEYDRAKQHMERAKANGVTDPESTAFIGFYRPTPYGDTTEMRIPQMLDRLRADLKALESDADFAKVALMVKKARPAIFEAPATNDTASKLQARQDRKAKADRDEPTIELRKRLSVLRSLKECLG